MIEREPSLAAVHAHIERLQLQSKRLRSEPPHLLRPYNPSQPFDDPTTTASAASSVPEDPLATLEVFFASL